MRVFAFVNLDHPAAAWAVMRGIMVSADHAHVPAHPGFISFMQAGMIEHQNNPRIFNEALIEEVRIKNFNACVSRMRGIYFFRSFAEAEAALAIRIGHRTSLLKIYLSWNSNQAERPTVVDSNWITFAPLGPDSRIRRDDLSWIDRYWAGEPHNEHPVWELLANGTAQILDTRVRRRCHEYVSELFPTPTFQSLWLGSRLRLVQVAARQVPFYCVRTVSTSN
jgi:hypothetical protein